MHQTEIAPSLMEWFYRNHRELPWRQIRGGRPDAAQQAADRSDKGMTEIPDAPAQQTLDASAQIHAYHVWISEIMLQQTRVEAVKPYYARFLRRLPDPGALSLVPEEELMKLWEGLGYYSRARNLKKAAIRIMEEYGGRIPTEYEELLKLPGIGPYTAGAIASIAFSGRVAAVDGNVLRVIMRLNADDSDISEEGVKKLLQQELPEAMGNADPGDFNQALMDLGAMVCTPNGTPDCQACPWQNICLAHLQGRETDFPVKAPKKPRKTEEMTVLLIRDHRRVLLHKRGEKGLLAGLYEFPNLPGHVTGEAALAYAERLGFTPLHLETLESAKHIFTHKEWEMTGYAIRIADPGTDPDRRTGDHLFGEGYLFADADTARERYAIPSAFAAFAKYLNIRTGHSALSEEIE